MGKKALIAALTVTVTLAVAVFVCMWLLRPGATGLSEELLKRAEERQQVPLLEIESPINMNESEITEEERIAGLAASEIINNQSLLDSIAKRVVELLPSTVTQADLNKAIVNSKDYIGDEIDKAKDDAALYTDTQIEALNRQIRTYLQQEIQRVGLEGTESGSQEVTLDEMEIVDSILSSSYFKEALDEALLRLNLTRVPDSPDEITYSTNLAGQND